MTEDNKNNIHEKVSVEEKILLALLPFWDPQIPPLGIACLQSHLRKNNFNVKAVDANIKGEFRNYYDNYFSVLKKVVPPGKQGNIFNIGNQVLRSHLMARLNYPGEEKYVQLVKILVEKTFFTQIEESAVKELDQILQDFYTELEEYFMELLEKEQPTVLGLTVYGDTFPASLAAFKMAKKWNPSIKNVMGGGIFADQLAPGSPNLEYLAQITEDYIDLIVIGEGEEIMEKFLKGELPASERVFSLKEISSTGVGMDEIDIPYFSDFDLNFYPHLAHFGARSCPFQCKFCSETINWGKYRKKKVQKTLSEFQRFYQDHSCQLFLLTDSTLNPTITPLSKAVIEADAAVYWDGFLRADRHVCNLENTMLWRKGGFYRAKLGLESGSQKVLDLMRKEITIQQSREALFALANAGIKTTTFWLFGFPGETEEDFLMTLDFLEENKDHIYEADCNAFNYYLTGQANSEEWLENNKGVLLYPQWTKEILISQTWILEGEPTREQAYDRVNRFVEHCRKLGIPNPYSLGDIKKADERWQKLHANAVPSLLDLSNKDICVNESRKVRELATANPKDLESEDFDF